MLYVCINCANKFETHNHLNFVNQFCDNCREDFVQKYNIDEQFRYDFHNKEMAKNKEFAKAYVDVLRKHIHNATQKSKPVEIEQEEFSRIYGCVDCGKSFRSVRALQIPEMFCKNCKIKHIQQRGLPMKMLETFADPEFVKAKADKFIHQTE